MFQQEPSWVRGRMSPAGQHRVIVSFGDTEGDEHHIGEQWTFLGSWFSKFDDDVTLFVRTPDAKNFRFSLHWTPDTQENVIENILTYLEYVRR